MLTVRLAETPSRGTQCGSVEYRYVRSLVSRHLATLEGQNVTARCAE